MVLGAASVLDAADRLALCDYKLSQLHGNDVNPFSTDGARNMWQRGYDGLPPRSYEGSYEVNTIYQRGAAMRRLQDKLNAPTD